MKKYYVESDNENGRVTSELVEFKRNEFDSMLKRVIYGIEFKADMEDTYGISPDVSSNVVSDFFYELIKHDKNLLPYLAEQSPDGDYILTTDTVGDFMNEYYSDNAEDFAERSYD